MTRTQSLCKKIISQRSAGSRGFFPGTPVSFHGECRQDGLGNTARSHLNWCMLLWQPRSCD